MKLLSRLRWMAARALPCLPVLLAFAAMPQLSRGAEPVTVETNRVAEVTFTSQKDHKDPFNELELDVVFTGPAGKPLRVPAFWAGGRLWRVRFAAPKAGTYPYRSECSDSADGGLHGVEGKIEVRLYRGDNPLYRHGPVQVAADRRHFQHADGTPFFWLGDTWWMGLCERLKWPDEVKTLAADRKDKGFNVIQIVAGLYPDMPAFDERGRNEAGFPWEKDYRRIRPEYFDRADERLFYLADQGFVPCIVGAWGYHLPWLGVAKMKQHWRYLVARYGALPVVWCAAGEVNLPYYLEKGFPQGGEKQTADWEGVIRSLRKVNALGRLITVHPTGLPPLSGRGLYRDQTLLDFDMLQTGHGGKEIVTPTIQAVRASYEARPTMPVVNGEVCYEALLGGTPADVVRLMFWAEVVSGVAGHTYGANGIWQLNRKERPYGKSPHGGDYGHIPWDEARKLPGSGQLGRAKKLLECYPWHKLEPHPEWATWKEGDGSSIRWGDWIWYPEGDPARDAPVAPRFFRKAFTLPDGKGIRAVLHLTVDNQFTAYLNGQKVGSGSDWMAAQEFTDCGRLLRPGKNVLAVLGENAPGPEGANPAGLACSLEVSLTGGKKVTVSSDGTWRCSAREEKDWQELTFNDQSWEHARKLAPFGEGPWGTQVKGPNAGSQDRILQPYAAGIPGKLRIVYLPRPLAVTIHKLDPDQRYTASTFDPVSGRRSEIGSVRSDEQGSCSVPPPPMTQGDWVLLMEAAGSKP